MPQVPRQRVAIFLPQLVSPLKAIDAWQSVIQTIPSCRGLELLRLANGWPRINLLPDFVALVQEKNTRSSVTIVAPTPREEKRLSFDEIFEGPPSGRVLALQFKRPLEGKIAGVVNYTLNVIQQVKLLNSFAPREAFYALVPYPTVRSFVANRQ